MSLLIGLDRGDERGLAGRARPALAPETGIVALDRPAERVLPASLHHHLHQLVVHALGGVVGDARLAVQRRRAPFLPWVME